MLGRAQQPRAPHGPRGLQLRPRQGVQLGQRGMQRGRSQPVYPEPVPQLRALQGEASTLHPDNLPSVFCTSAAQTPGFRSCLWMSHQRGRSTRHPAGSLPLAGTPWWAHWLLHPATPTRRAATAVSMPPSGSQLPSFSSPGSLQPQKGYIGQQGCRGGDETQGPAKLPSGARLKAWGLYSREGPGKGAHVNIYNLISGHRRETGFFCSSCLT